MFQNIHGSYTEERFQICFCNSIGTAHARKGPISVCPLLRWAQSPDSYRRIASKSYRRDSNHQRSLAVISLPKNTEFGPHRPCVLCTAIWIARLAFVGVVFVVISMSRAKNSLPIVPGQFLSLSYPLWNCPLNCPSNCPLKWFKPWKYAIWGQKLSLKLSLEYPRGEGNWAARQGQKLSRGNFYPAATRCLTGPPISDESATNIDQSARNQRLIATNRPDFVTILRLGLRTPNIRSTWHCGMACESWLHSLNASDWRFCPSIARRGRGTRTGPLAS